MSSFCSSTYRACLTGSGMTTQLRSVLWPIAKTHHTEASVLWEIEGKIGKICMKLVAIQSLYHSDMNYVLSTDVNSTETTNCSFGINEF